MAPDPSEFGFESFGRPATPGVNTPEQQRTAAAVIKLIGFLQPFLRGGFFYGAVGDDETNVSRSWNAWELTGYGHGNLGVAVAVPDILSMYINGQFRSTVEEQAEDARLERELHGHYCGFIQRPRGLSRRESRPPKDRHKLATVLHAANVNLAEWLSAYLLLGHVLTENDEMAAIVKTSRPPGMSLRAYWQSALVAVDYAQAVYLVRAGFRPMVSILGRVSTELQDIVDLRPSTTQELLGDDRV